jgi:hypothetical protein
MTILLEYLNADGSVRSAHIIHVSELSEWENTTSNHYQCTYLAN